MRKVELTLSSNYVANWTLVDAVRELFQNAIDQGDWYYNYKDKENALWITNEKATLEMNTLLLGTSNKAKGSIGQFGEGYKIAALVLLREGKELCIYNGNEIWRPRMVKSRRFGTEILTFFIEKPMFLENSGLTIVVSGITPEEWHTSIMPSNLHLQVYQPLFKTTEGEVLSDAQYKGQVYVGGLFVCYYTDYVYGYNFTPGFLKLDRDRKLASDFDLKWLASTIWRKLPTQAAELAMEGAQDVAYVSYMGSGDALNAAALESFRALHGVYAVPCVRQDQLTRVPAGYRGIIVPENFHRLVTSARGYKEPDLQPVLTPVDRLKAWQVKFNERYSDAELNEELEEIIEALL